MSSKRLILASASPRRRELLGYITDDFEVKVSEVDERAIEVAFVNNPKNLNSSGVSDNKKLAETLALSKARAVFNTLDLRENVIVIGSDTSVVIDNRILGKPRSREEAREMLEMLSGHTHSVVTGVALVSSDKEVTFTNESLVTFNPLDEYQRRLIEEYCASREPYDKAGAYGIQGRGALLISRIDGDFYSVMGLPISELSQQLCKF